MEAKAIKGMLQRIETNLDEKYTELANNVDQQMEEIRERGGTTSETKDKITALETETESLREAAKELKEMVPEFNALKSKLEGPGLPHHKGRTSPGVSFVESDEFKNFDAQSDLRTKAMPLGGLENLLPESKAISSDENVWGGAGLLIEPQVLPGIIRSPERQLRLRDLVNVQSVSTDMVRFYKETGFANLYTVTRSNAASLQAVISVESAAGFFAGQTVVVGGVTKIVAPGGVDSANNTLTMTTPFAAAVPAGSEVMSDHLAGTPHGGQKPQANIRFDDAEASIITIAHWMGIHRQTLEDAPQLRGYINSRLTYGLDLALEQQGLYGTGGANQLLGLFNQPGVQNQGQRTGNDPNGRPWTEIDWIRMAMTKAQVAEYPVDGLMVNPLNWQAIELAKDLEGRYLWITVTENGVRRLFGVPVVVSTAMRAGDFLTGAFGLGVTLLDRHRATIRVSDSHASMFIENALAILAEIRVGLLAIRPESLIFGRF